MARRRNLTAAAGVPSNCTYQVPNERIQAAPLDLVGRAAVRHVREVTLQEGCGSAWPLVTTYLFKVYKKLSSIGLNFTPVTLHDWCLGAGGCRSNCMDSFD
jgi:hypothetical protein